MRLYSNQSDSSWQAYLKFDINIDRNWLSSQNKLKMGKYWFDEILTNHDRIMQNAERAHTYNYKK